MYIHLLPHSLLSGQNFPRILLHFLFSEHFFNPNSILVSVLNICTVLMSESSFSLKITVHFFSKCSCKQLPHLSETCYGTMVIHSIAFCYFHIFGKGQFIHMSSTLELRPPHLTSYSAVRLFFRVDSSNVQAKIREHHLSQALSNSELSYFA